MVREFMEEAGVSTSGWYNFGEMDGSWGIVHMFRTYVEDLDAIGLKSMTDEQVEIHTMEEVYSDKTIGVLHNVQMLLATATSLDVVYGIYKY